MDAALAALSRAVKLDARHAESHALLGTLYGMKIDGNLLRAGAFRARVEKHCKAALEFGRGQSAGAVSARDLPVSHGERSRPAMA